MNQPATSRFGVPVRPERDGNEIQLLGPGVGQVPNGPECVDAVRWALELTDSELARLDALDVTDGADGAREGAW